VDDHILQPNRIRLPPRTRDLQYSNLGAFPTSSRVRHGLESSEVATPTTTIRGSRAGRRRANVHAVTEDERRSPAGTSPVDALSNPERRSKLASPPHGHFTTTALADDCARFLAESRLRAQARAAETHATRRFS
jgi:hypothetical protein